MNQKIDNTIVATIITSFAVIGAALLSAYTSSKLQGWSLSVAFIILSIQTCVVLYVILSITGFFERLSRYKQKRYENKLAKKFFDEFKQKDFAAKFYSIQSTDNDSPHNSYTFHNVIEKLRAHDDFRELPKPNIKPIKAHFYFWKDLYNRFNGKDASTFKLLLEDFSRIVNEYNGESVSTPLDNIRNIIQRAKERNKQSIEIGKSLKEEWRVTMEQYNYFEKNYNDFVKRVNEAFKDRVASTIYIARDLP